MIKQVEEIVRKHAVEDDWKYHILLVRKYSLQLAEMLKADKEIVEISALLHDIGRQKFGPENHEIIGAKEAVIILKKLGYPSEKIKKVEHCILVHRGSSKIKPETLEAEIIMNTDAMAHFDTLPLLLFVAKRERSFEEAVKFVHKKIEKDWNNKLTLSQAKDLMKEKYGAIKIVLESMMDLF